MNVHDVAGNPQVRYTAELPPTRAERDYQITTRELEAGQYIQLEIENIDTNNITFLGRQTDASGFQIVNSEFIIARTYGSGT